MKRKLHTPEQIVNKLREADTIIGGCRNKLCTAFPRLLDKPLRHVSGIRWQFPVAGISWRPFARTYPLRGVFAIVCRAAIVSVFCNKMNHYGP